MLSGRRKNGKRSRERPSLWTGQEDSCSVGWMLLKNNKWILIIIMVINFRRERKWAVNNYILTKEQK